MRSRTRIAIALTIAGSDSGGGAGIQADLKTFAALGVHGTSVLTCVTAQNPARVVRTEACSPGIIRAQLQAVFEELRPRAVKTGMLYSVEIVREVARFLQGEGRLPLVVDPVMVSTSGARLMEAGAVLALSEELLSMAALMTPNLHEAALLVGRKIGSVEEMRWVAKELQRRFGCAVLVKGGHLGGMKQAVDVFYNGRDELLLSAPFVRGVKTHGTGCTFASALLAQLAAGRGLIEAATLAKAYVTKAIEKGYPVGKGRVPLDHFYRLKIEPLARGTHEVPQHGMHPAAEPAAH